jgi:hypothetical protein
VSGIGDALIDVVLDGARKDRGRHVRRLFAWAAKLAKPPVGVRLVSDDGGDFTGFVIVDANRPIAMLALRVGTSGYRPPSREQQYMRPVFDDPHWRDGEDPYR